MPLYSRYPRANGSSTANDQLPPGCRRDTSIAFRAIVTSRPVGIHPPAIFQSL
jgi:hypothetical protein